MTRTAYSIKGAGWILMIAGSLLILFPGALMLFFWEDTVDSFWLRTLGYFMVLEGMVNYKSAFYEITPLYRWLMNFRLAQPGFFLVLLLVDFANPGLMLYSTLELLLGLWTFLVYKRENP